MDHERLRRAQITESVLRHFHVWLTAMLGGTAAPEDTDRFLPMLTEAGIDLDNLQIAAFVLDGHGGDERPAGMPYFDTEQVEKALLAQDYDALRAEIDRVLLPLAEQLPEYRTVDQLCLSLLFHVSLWGLRYGIQMEEVLRTLGAHYTDIYQSETLAAKRDFVLACLFGCQQALARRRSHSHTVKSVAMRVREYVDAEYCSNALSLESVAAYVHKTPAYISRVFKNELGCNFSDYLTEKRMRLAAQLLAKPEGKVYRIAAQCGYADTSNFIRVFKRFYGVSPMEYRTVQGGAK